MGSMGDGEGRCGKVKKAPLKMAWGDGSKEPTKKELDCKERKRLGASGMGEGPGMKM